MTLNVHDGGFGSAGGYNEDEEGTTAGDRDHRDSPAARAASGTCDDGDDDVGDDRGDGEPYVVFGYGSLIFRVRLCHRFTKPTTRATPPHAHAFAASTTRHQNE